RAVLGEVDRVAAKHGLSFFGQARFTREIEQQLDGTRHDAVLRIIEIQPACFGAEALAALRILLKQLPQVQRADLAEVTLELPHRRALEPGSENRRVRAGHGAAS